MARIKSTARKTVGVVGNKRLVQPGFKQPAAGGAKGGRKTHAATVAGPLNRDVGAAARRLHRRRPGVVALK